MKKFFISFALVVLTAGASVAQCDKKVVLTGNKTDQLRADSTLDRSKDEQSEITIEKNTVTVVAGDNPVMTGTVLSSTCDWKTPFKDGKWVLKTSFTDGGEAKNVTITITGKAGKIDFLAVVEGEGRMIRVSVTKFEEKAK